MPTFSLVIKAKDTKSRAIPWTVCTIVLNRLHLLKILDVSRFNSVIVDLSSEAKGPEELVWGL